MPPQKVPCHPAPVELESESESKEEEVAAVQVYPSHIPGCYPCPHPKCGKVFKYKYDVPYHATTHNKDDEYLCHEKGCEYRMSSYKLVMDHTKTCRGMHNMRAHTVGRNLSTRHREANMRQSIAKSVNLSIFLCLTLCIQNLFMFRHKCHTYLKQTASCCAGEMGFL